MRMENRPHHHGEWMMEPEDLRKAFDTYWDDDWQIHIHVNGDLGLEVLVEIIERNAVSTHRSPHCRRALCEFNRGVD